MKLTGRSALLLVPVVAIVTVLLILPLLNVAVQSFEQYVPGRIGAANNAPYTFGNYIGLFQTAYIYYFLGTFRIGFTASIIALLVAYPIAYFIAHQRAGLTRKLSVIFLIAMIFLSALVRVYSIELTFGPIGFLRQLSALFRLPSNSRAMLEVLVTLGLLHFIIPISALTLLGTLQNLNPRLIEAAQTLGAPSWRAHITVTIPLSARGLLSSFLISYTLCISAFVVPLILGQGKVLFISNLVYARFSEVADYPSGAAISMVMLLLSLLIIYFVSRAAAARWGTV